MKFVVHLTIIVGGETECTSETKGMQKFERWQAVEVLHEGEWVQGCYLEPYDDKISDLAHSVIFFGHNGFDDGGFVDSAVRPMPIRRGDVVQWFNIYSGKCSVGVVTAITETCSVNFDRTQRAVEPEDLTRIGRAKYMPDGTPVED